MRTRSPGHCVACVAVAVVVVVAACMLLVEASRGDEEPVFVSCVANCERTSCRGEHAKSPTLHLRLMGWTCEENCRYECMHQVSDMKDERGEQLEQYYGKWPFTRVLGMQELFSVLFSFGNMIPFVYYRNAWRKRASPKFYLVPLFKIYCLVGINTWLWSAAFHARDTWWTERLDYHCASLLVLYQLFMGIVRFWEISSVSKQLAIAAVLFGALFAHILYMNLVLFDYGFNMLMSVIVAVANTVIWVIHNFKHPRPFTWKIWVGIGGTWVLGAMFELRDFAPIVRLLDAHACWHGGTIPLAFLWFGFLLDDMEDLQRGMPSTEKRAR